MASDIIESWCESFLVGTGRFQSVLVDGVKSAEESVMSGVPQGTVSGAADVLVLYINDLPSRVNINTRCRLFADDCLFYRIIDGLEDQVQLVRPEGIRAVGCRLGHAV